MSMEIQTVIKQIHLNEEFIAVVLLLQCSDALKDDSACESVELEFNVNDFQYLEFSYSWNIGHRYYINDQKTPTRGK